MRIFLLSHWHSVIIIMIMMMIRFWNLKSLPWKFRKWSSGSPNPPINPPITQKPSHKTSKGGLRMHLRLHFAHFWHFLWEGWEGFLSWLPLGSEKSVFQVCQFFLVVGSRVGPKKKTHLKHTWNWLLIPSKLKTLPYPPILLHFSLSKK